MTSRGDLITLQQARWERSRRDNASNQKRERLQIRSEAALVSCELEIPRRLTKCRNCVSSIPRPPLARPSAAISPPDQRHVDDGSVDSPDDGLDRTRSNPDSGRRVAARVGEGHAVPALINRWLPDHISAIASFIGRDPLTTETVLVLCVCRFRSEQT
jgi:hypothetical protein